MAIWFIRLMVINVYRVSINTIRGDYKDGKENKNRLRLWEKSDFIPRADDIFQERLYCVQWMKQKQDGKKFDYEFRTVTADDLKREQMVIDYVQTHLADWQEKGFVPDMVIETGTKTDEPIRTRGWTHWHHLFFPRQLQIFGLMRKHQKNPETSIDLARMLDWNARLCSWRGAVGADANAHIFTNQALNTIWNPPSRSWDSCQSLWIKTNHPEITVKTEVASHPAQNLETENDIYITDPPYGDAVKYEEITEFFIAWLRKNPPAEFAHWTWDSRRSLANQRRR
jgi:putative DNA methylase